MNNTFETSLLTIAICTYNRAKFLDFCLESLLFQSTGTDIFNIIIIDNASKDNTLNIFHKYKNKFNNIKYIYNDIQGLSQSRNIALEATITPWIAYLDDDAKAHSNWAYIAINTIRKNIFDVFGGVFLPWYYFGPPPQWCPLKNFTNAHIQEYFGIMPDGKFPSGGNCVYNTHLLRKFGGFSREFGMNGKKIAYGEETFLIQRMRNSGLRIGFVPQLRIDHCVLKNKYKMSWHFKAAYASSRDWIRIVSEQQNVSISYSKALKKIFIDFLKGIKFFIKSAYDPDYTLQQAFFEYTKNLAISFGFLAALKKIK